MIANARMYSVTLDAREAWGALFRHVAAQSGVALDVIEHPFPLPVADLWTRDDLVCAFMCGWPWVRGGARHQPVAAPVPADAGAPEYWTDIVVAADSPARSLDDLAGATLGFTLLDSQSGFSALRHHLRGRAVRFGAIEGPLTTPRRVMEAVAAGRIAAGPIDSYAHAMLRRHLPSLTDQVRVLERTARTPIPMLVASPGADPAVVALLRAALLGPVPAALLEPLALTGFAEPLPRAAYQAMEDAARDAEAAGIRDLSPFLRAAVPA